MQQTLNRMRLVQNQECLVRSAGCIHYPYRRGTHRHKRHFVSQTRVLGRVTDFVRGISTQKGGDTKTAKQTTQQTEVDAANTGGKALIAVVGATGKLGSCIIKKLLSDNFKVRALIRSTDKTIDIVQDYESDFEIISGFDISDQNSYKSEFLKDVQTVVLAVGGSGDAYLPSEIDAGGVSKFAAYLSQELQRDGQADRKQENVVNLVQGAEWLPLNDTIMGGQSNSSSFYRGSTLCWTGTLVFERGGFCGIRSSTVLSNLPNDIHEYDGITFRVLGDGQKYKISIRTSDNEGVSESSYQAQFDTVCDEWNTVSLCWHEFVPVQQTQVQTNAPPLNPRTIQTFGLVLSKFTYNGMNNVSCKEGSFLLQIAGGIQPFRKERADVILISSAAVERNENIENKEQRDLDIPIVQMNPKNVLNYKYIGETAIRESSLAYSIIRPTGLKDDVENPGGILVTQGDYIAGTISRDDIADVVVEIINNGYGLNSTMEVTRSNTIINNGNVDQDRVLMEQMLKIVPDSDRTNMGLRPFSKPKML